jgi:hypothetical protein
MAKHCVNINLTKLADIDTCKNNENGLAKKFALPAKKKRATTHNGKTHNMK